jgi:CheY-like chemotaxis protein
MASTTKAITKALIVDDDEDILSLCKVSLRHSSGWTVKLARSSEAAIRAACDHAPDVILLDVMIAGDNGLAVLDELKRCEATAGIPVVMMTAAVAAVTADCKRRGAVGLIPKPFDPATLSAEIERLLEAAS